MAIEQLSNNSGGKEDLTKDDILAELNSDDDSAERQKEEESRAPKKEKVKEKAEKDDDDEEVDDDEIELEEGDEEDEDDEEDKDEKEDDVHLVAPFRKADIEKDFPGIFKKYGYLEKSYYRDRAYTEVFASPEDAKEAAEQIEEQARMEQALFQGNTSDLLKRVKESDPRAFNRMADKYMDNLREVDPQAHNHVVGGIVKNLISLLAREGRRTNNDDFRKVALAINQFVFDSDQYEPHKPLSDTAKDDEVSQERQQFFQERYDTVQEELQTKVDDILETTIKNNIDPKDVLSDYVKKNVIRDAMDDLRSTIAKDASFRKQLDKLWERAFASNFKKDSIKAIQDAYLNRAKMSLRPVITKAKTEALKGNGKRVRENSDSDTEKTERREYHKGTKRGSTSSNQGGQRNTKADGFKGSTLDFLNQD